MAEYKDVASIDIPARLKGKGEGDHERPKPHVSESDYKKNYEASITKTDEFWGKVSSIRKLAGIRIGS